MHHRKVGRTLGRNASHRLALMRNLSIALIEHGRIVTTVAKAKELRPWIEKLVTLAKEGTLHARRLALARLPNRTAVAKLFDDLGPRFADRPGGYTRILKRVGGVRTAERILPNVHEPAGQSQPEATIVYTAGGDSKTLSWTGDASFVPHYLKVAGRERIRVRLRWGNPLEPSSSTTDRELAFRAHDFLARAIEEAGNAAAERA